MPKKSEDANSMSEKPDLSSLLDMDFGPAWSSGTPAEQLQESSQKKSSRHRDKGPYRHDSGGRLDRRQGTQPDRRQGKRDGFVASRKSTPPKDESPFHEVSFYPSPDTFKALAASLRKTGRTYELFELANMILAKPERFLVRVSLPKKVVEEGKSMCVSKEDGLIFNSAEEVVEHLITKRSEQLYEVEKVEVEPPSGNFPAIARCGMTGTWLGPKNYHRYAEIIHEHHVNKLPEVPFAKFEAKIEIITTPEASAAWLEEMRIANKYKLKIHKENAPESFASLDALRKHLTLHKISELVRTSVKAEFPGRLLDDLPEGRLKDDIRKTLEKQRRFPLETALALLGRFRAAKFHHFKRGKKGIAYISYVKRRQRLLGETFSPSIETLLAFVEGNPLVEKGSLAEKHLGITAGKRENDKSSNKIHSLARDILWLVKEGYVTEYADGRLETRPSIAQSEGKKRGADKEETREGEGSFEMDAKTPTTDPETDVSSKSSALGEVSSDNNAPVQS